MPVRDIETESGERRELAATTLPGLRAIESLEHHWHERRTILAWTAAGFVISVILCFFIPKYEATVQIMPPDNGSQGGLAALAALTAGPNVPGIGSLGDALGMSTKTPSSLLVKVLQSDSVEGALVDRFKLGEHYGLVVFHLVIMQRDYEDAEDKLDSRTKISEDKKSGVITIVVRDKDPKFATDIANGYVDELNKVMARVSTSAAGREREFIEKRLAEEKVALEDSERQFSQFASSNMALDVPTQTRVMVETSARLQGELVAARAQLQGLEQIYTPESSRVKSLRGQIGALEAELRKINSGAQGAPDSTNPYPSVKTLPSLGVEWTDLYRAQKTHEAVYEYLTSQYESARIREAKDIPTVKTLDHARMPLKRHPRPSLVILIGTGCALLLACIGVDVKRRWDAWDEDDPRRAMLARFYHRGRSRVAPVLDRLPWRRDRERPPDDLKRQD